MPPNCVEQLAARLGAARPFHEMAQQTEFGRAKGDLNAIAFYPHSNRIKLQIANHQRAASYCRTCAAQYRLDAGAQFTRRKGFGDIVIGAGFKPADTVLFLATCCQHDDRDRCRFLAFAQATANLDARQLFDHPIEDDYVGSELLGNQQCFFAIGGLFDGKSRALERPRQKFGERRLILNYQDFRRHASSSTRTAPLRSVK